MSAQPISGKEFYERISMLPNGELALKDYFRALHDLVVLHKNKETSFEFFLQLLEQACYWASKEIPFKELNLDVVPAVKENEISEGLQELLDFLERVISIIEEDGIPDGNDTYFNWTTWVILGNGANWFTGGGKETVILDNATWADLLQILEIGREYE